MMMIEALVPLRLRYHGHTKKERVRAAEHRRLDLVALPLFGVWYLALASIANPFGDSAAKVAADGYPLTDDASFLLVLLRAALAVVASYMLAIHVFLMPCSQEAAESFAAEQHFGRWIYFTRHCLAIQAWHQIFSLVASLWVPRLSPSVHAMSVVVASLGWFVTVQFFVLIHGEPSHEEEWAAWARQGIQVKQASLLLHGAALPVALLDLLLAKDARQLSESLSCFYTFGLTTLYTLLFLLLLKTNYWLTRTWAYSFMSSFGNKVLIWCGFWLRQIAVIQVSCGANWLLARWRMGEWGGGSPPGAAVF